MLDLSVSAIPDEATKRGELAACPSCSAPAPPAFIRLTELPVHGTAVFATAAEARAVVTGDQELALCGSCGLVFNRAFDMSKLDYTGEHEESQHRSPLLRRLRRQLSAAMGRAAASSPAGRVVEIGCGAGDFAAELLSAGVGRVVGIDPHFGPERVPAGLARRLAAVPGVLRTPRWWSPAPPPSCVGTRSSTSPSSPCSVRTSSRDAAAGIPVLLAEVPDLGRILDRRRVLGPAVRALLLLHPCHLGRLPRAAGFAVSAARPPTPTSTWWPRPFRAGGSGRAGLESVAELGPLRRSPKGSPRNHRADRPLGPWLDDRATAGDSVVVWGGGAKGLTFLDMLRGHTDPVSAVVDINPGLQHHYIGGLGLPIVAPRDLVRHRRERCC